MAHLEIQIIDTLPEFRRAAPQWDDLWRRSDVCLPGARAALVAQCVEHFSPRSQFCALVVRRGDRFVAGLPLVSTRIHGLFKVATLPRSQWASYGTLLMDPA